jgi:hypothetical protein
VNEPAATDLSRFTRRDAHYRWAKCILFARERQLIEDRPTQTRPGTRRAGFRQPDPLGTDMSSFRFCLNGSQRIERRLPGALRLWL